MRGKLIKHNHYARGNIGIGIQLMIVGMSTVFLILLIVIWGGKALISVVNKIAPEEEQAPKKAATTSQAVDATTMAVLQQVVSQITGGKGKLSSARRI